MGGGTPLCGITPPVGRDGTIVVLSWCYRDTIMLLLCYRSDTGITRQGRSLMASSMRGAKQQGGRRLAVSPEGTARRGPGSNVMDREGGFGAEIFLDREIHAPRREKTSKWGVLSNLRVSSWSLLETGPRTQLALWLSSSDCHCYCHCH